MMETPIPQEKPILRLDAPETLSALPWHVIKPEEKFGMKAVDYPEAANKFEGLLGYLKDKGLRMLSHLGVFRGGRMLTTSEYTTGKSIKDQTAADRMLGVIPVTSERDGKIDRVVHYPTEKDLIHFSANFAAYRGSYGRFAKSNWDGTLGVFPIPLATPTGRQATDSGMNPSDTYSTRISDGFVTDTEYRPGLSSLGLNGPEKGGHQMDISKVSEKDLRKLVRVLDAVHLKSEDYLDDLKKRGNEGVAPSESWLYKLNEKDKNQKCNLRGIQWWVNKDGNDRLHELWGQIDEAEDAYKTFDENFDFKFRLGMMITNNLPLYRNQDSSFLPENERLLGETVVVHGTVNPDNVHLTRDPNTDNTQFTLTGGDRSQLYGLRGQTIDWLISGSAGSPEFQNAMIEEFKKIQVEKNRDVNKEMRGLAMHAMYRCVMDIPWYIKEGKTIEAENLIKLTKDILSGNGIWEGVNTDMRETQTI